MFVRSLRVFRVMRLAAASENLREVLMSAARSLKVVAAKPNPTPNPKTNPIAKR